MGVLDIFNGNAGRNAAIWGAGNQQAGAAQQAGAINTGANLSLAALNKGATEARNNVLGQYKHGLGELRNATGSAAQIYNRNPALLQGGADRADAFYAPLGEEANRGFSVYGDAAGVNGAAGQDRARANFRAGPGYRFTVDEATNAAVRGANAAGMAASGNTLDSVTRLGANLADKEFDDYMTRLNPYLSLAPSIAGSRAGIQTQLGQDLSANNAAIAGLYQTQGRDASALRLGQGNTLASLASGLGSNTANIRTGQAQALSNIAGANTSAQTSLGTSGMMAGQQGDANAWNAGMQVANLAAGAAGKFKNPFG